MAKKNPDILNELKSLAPLLSEVHAHRDEAPKGYFETMQAQVIDEMNSVDVSAPAVSARSGFLKMAIAASIVALLGLTFIGQLFSDGEGAENYSAFAQEMTYEDELLAIDDDIFYEVYIDGLEIEEQEMKIEFLLDEDANIEELILDLES